MADPEHVEIVKQGRDAIEKWREGISQMDALNYGMDLHEAILAGASLANADLSFANLTGADLSGASLVEACLTGADLSGADLTGADLSGAVLKDTRLDSAIMTEARLIVASLPYADLSGADLSGADLSNAVLWRANLADAILTGAILTGADLTSANLTDADIAGAFLTSANLWSANLMGANLSGSDLTGANLTDSKLTSVDLSGAKLNGAEINGTDLTGTTLVETDLRKSRMRASVFGRNDLSRCRGLDEVFHWGPSSIGVDTLYLSMGKIPKSFLRGCGIPAGLITYLPSLLGTQEAIQFDSCFISYSHKDEEFCQRLHSRMRDESLRVWFAPEDMKGGRKIHEQIESAIQVHDRLLLILTETSMESEWVKTEIHHARQREAKEGRQVLFPVRLVPFERIRAWKAFDADTGKDMAREVREYFIPDFTEWKEHDEFEKSFKQLLSDLRKAASA